MNGVRVCTSSAVVEAPHLDMAKSADKINFKIFFIKFKNIIFNIIFFIKFYY